MLCQNSEIRRSILIFAGNISDPQDFVLDRLVRDFDFFNLWELHGFYQPFFRVLSLVRMHNRGKHQL